MFFRSTLTPFTLTSMNYPIFLAEERLSVKSAGTVLPLFSGNLSSIQSALRVGALIGMFLCLTRLQTIQTVRNTSCQGSVTWLIRHLPLLIRYKHTML